MCHTFFIHLHLHKNRGGSGQFENYCIVWPICEHPYRDPQEWPGCNPSYGKVLQHYFWQYALLVSTESCRKCQKPQIGHFNTLLAHEETRQWNPVKMSLVKLSLVNNGIIIFNHRKDNKTNDNQPWGIGCDSVINDGIMMWNEYVGVGI